MDAPLLGADAVGTAAESVDLTAEPGASVRDEDELLDELLDEPPS